MKKFEQKRYRVLAKRKGTGEKWTAWTNVDHYDDAVKHSKYIEGLGYLAKIVDRGGCK